MRRRAAVDNFRRGKPLPVLGKLRKKLYLAMSAYKYYLAQTESGQTENSKQQIQSQHVPSVLGNFQWICMHTVYRDVEISSSTVCRASFLYLACVHTKWRRFSISLNRQWVWLCMFSLAEQRFSIVATGAATIKVENITHSVTFGQTESTII